MKFRQLLRSGGMLLAAQVVATASQFAYQWHTSRMLTQEDFGALGSLLSGFMIGTLPLSTLMLYVTYQVARYRIASEPGLLRSFQRRMATRCLGAGVVVLVGGWLSTPWLCEYLHIRERLPVDLLWLTLFCALLARVPYGTFQGRQEFSWLAAFMGVPPTIRLLLAVLLPPSLTWFMAVGAATALLEILGGYLVIFRSPPAHPPEEGPSALPTANLDFGFTFLGMACLAVMTNVDVLLIRNAFPDAASGHYALVTAISKGLIFFPLSIAYVLFPSVSEQSMLRNDPRLLLAKSLLTTAVLVVACCVPCLLLPEFIISLFDPVRFAPAVDLLRLVVVAAVPLALVNILVHHLLATRNRGLLYWGVPLAAAHTLALVWFGTGPARMLLSMGASGLIVTLAFSFMAFRE